MNKVIILFCLLFCYSIYAQNSNSDFYPLSIGNKWEYIRLSYEVGPTPDTSYFTKEIIGDTLMPNGIRYFVVEEDNHIHYERYDTLTNEIKYYENGGCGRIDDAVYSLNYNPDSTVLWQRCEEIPYFISYDDSTYGEDSSLIILESDYLVTVYTAFRKNLGLFISSSREIGYYLTKLQGAVINGEIWGIITSIEENEIDNEFKLYQNYPNPFNPITRINYTVPYQSIVSIKIYDILGRELYTLVNEEKYAGAYGVEFNGSQLSSGVYLCKMQTSDFIDTKKLLLVK